MSKSNKLGIAISLLSVLVIGGSVYYYNDSISKSNEKISQTVVTTTTQTTTEKKLKLNKENIKITSEVKDGKTAIISLENIAERNLTEVVVETNYDGNKVAEILIPTFEKGTKKTIELSLDNKLDTASLKDNLELTSGFRMIERLEFANGNIKGEVLVSSLKSQEKSFYIEKIKESSLEQSKKDELIKRIEEAKDIVEIESLLKEHKIISELTLSKDHVIFKDGETDLKVELKNAEVITTTALAETSVTSSEEFVARQQQQTVQTVAAVPNLANDVKRLPVSTTTASITRQTPQTTAGIGGETLSSSGTTMSSNQADEVPGSDASSNMTETASGTMNTAGTGQ